MACLMNLFVLFASIAKVKADLIGFNRLGNTVRNFYRFREGQNIDYQLTNYQSIMENTTLTMEHKRELLNFLAHKTTAQNRRKKRRKTARVHNSSMVLSVIRRPCLNRKKTRPSTGKRVSKRNRLNLYESRMNHKLQI